MNSVTEFVQNLSRSAREGALFLAKATSKQKNDGLTNACLAIQEAKHDILQANQKDLVHAKEKNLSDALIDRLELTEPRFAAMIEGLMQVTQLPDPIGELSQSVKRPSGIEVSKMRVPLGVVAIVYESRPNVTVDAAALCFKSGNSCILRGGSEAQLSNQAIAKALQAGLDQAGIPPSCIQVIDIQDREIVKTLVSQSDYCDLLIPRGGKGLIEALQGMSRVPMIKHLDGNCHLYIDDLADLEKAHDLALNAKTYRFGTCNAMESLLIHQDIAAQVIPKLFSALREKQVEIRGCAQTKLIDSEVVNATEDDWYTEYLAPVLSVKIVRDVHQAIAHINQYGSHHTDAIITNGIDHARLFTQQVDSSSVMVNTSTAFADGFEYGLGAEIGISTDKFHARGPVGLIGLTTEKYLVISDAALRGA